MRRVIFLLACLTGCGGFADVSFLFCLAVFVLVLDSCFQLIDISSRLMGAK